MNEVIAIFACVIFCFIVYKFRIFNLSVGVLFICMYPLLFGFFYLFLPNGYTGYSRLEEWEVVKHILISSTVIVVTWFIFVRKVYIGGSVNAKSSLDVASRFAEHVPIILFVVFLVIGTLFGWSNILERNTHHVAGSNAFLPASVIAILSIVLNLLPAVAGIAMPFVSRRKKYLAVILLIVLIVYYLGMTSRYAALALVIFYIMHNFGRYIRDGRGGIVDWKLLFVIPVCLALMTIPLGARTLDSEGLVPLMAWVSTGLEFYSKYYSSLADMLISNLSHVYVATIDSHYSWQVIPDEYFWISINPLPGSMVGWYDIADDLTVIAHVPFSAYGQLVGHRVELIFLYSLTFGLFIGAVDRFVIGSPNTNIVLKILLFFFVFMALILMYQYALRSSIRLIYYCLVLWAFFGIFSLLKKKYQVRL